MGHQTFPNTDMSNLSFRSRWGHLAHLVGFPRSTSWNSISTWFVRFSALRILFSLRITTWVVAWLPIYTRHLTLASLWDDSGKIEPRISLVRYVYGCCWNVSKAKQLEEKYNWINKNSSKTEASNRFSSAGFSNGAVSGNISRHFWSNDSLY